MAGYIDPMTNFGFQRLFCQEVSKDILKQFLFDVLDLFHPIQEVTSLLSDQLPAMPNERMSVYGVYCIDVVGQTFVVKIQRGSQTFILKSINKSQNSKRFSGLCARGVE